MRMAVVALAVLAALGLSACAGGPSLENRSAITASPGDSHDLAIGSAGFTESELLAQMLEDTRRLRDRVMDELDRVQR